MSDRLPEDVLTLAEAARILRVDPSRLRRLAARGVLHATKFGKTWVTTKRDLDAFAQVERPAGYPRGRPRPARRPER